MKLSKLFFGIVVVFMSTLFCIAQQTNKTPINRGILQSDLDGGGKSGTNFGTIKSTNWVNAANGLPITTDGSVNSGVSNDFHNASNLNAGTVPSARLSSANISNAMGTSAISNAVHAAQADVAASATSATTATNLLALVALNHSGSNVYYATLEAANSNAVSGDTIYIYGTIDCFGSNSIVLKASRLTGYGAVLKNNFSSSLGRLLVPANCEISGVTITNNLNSQNLNQVSVGDFNADFTGITNSRLLDVTAYGDSDVFQCVTTNPITISGENCRFLSHWDDCVITAVNASYRWKNTTFEAIGPSAVSGGTGSRAFVSTSTKTNAFIGCVFRAGTNNTAFCYSSSADLATFDECKFEYCGTNTTISPETMMSVGGTNTLNNCVFRSINGATNMTGISAGGVVFLNNCQIFPGDTTTTQLLVNAGATVYINGGNLSASQISSAGTVVWGQWNAASIPTNLISVAVTNVVGDILVMGSDGFSWNNGQNGVDWDTNTLFSSTAGNIACSIKRWTNAFNGSWQQDSAQASSRWITNDGGRFRIIVSSSLEEYTNATPRGQYTANLGNAPSPIVYAKARLRGPITSDASITSPLYFITAGTNAAGAWPASPIIPGDIFHGSSNGVEFAIYSTNGAGGVSSSWTSTNRLGP